MLILCTPRTPPGPHQAIEKDPGYALAYAGLADAYNILGNWSILPPKEAYPKAKAAARKALEIDDALAEAHVSLAFASYLFDRDWSAEEGFKRAIALNPNYGPAHQWYGVCLLSTGRVDEAIAEARRAQEVEPFSLIINAVVGWVSFLGHRYDQAIEACRKTLEMEQSFSPAHEYLAMAYEAKGMYEEAIAEFQKARRRNPFMLGGLGHAYAMAGKKAEALKVVREMEKRAKKAYSSPYQVALVYAGLGKKDQAFQWLEKAYEERYPWLIHLKRDPRLEPLHSDPRFQDLVRRIGLPQ